MDRLNPKHHRVLTLRLLLCAGVLLCLAMLACNPTNGGNCQQDTDCLLGTYCHPSLLTCFSDCKNDQSCPADHKCDTNAGKCILDTVTCQPRVSQACRDGDMFWIDSCGKQTEKFQDCAGKGCTAQGCIKPPPSRCGDGACNALGGEDCTTCPQDCPCLKGLRCNPTTATCQEVNPCGDGTCEPNDGETCATCPKDCQCQGTDICDPNSGRCLPPSNSCPNGTCESAKGENCENCPADCKCVNAQTCKSGACVDPPSCGNGNCEAAKGEDCATCTNDCKCGTNKSCINGVCKEDSICNSNGVCDDSRGENCGNCAADCTCKAKQKCATNKCVDDNPCGDGTCASAQGENCQSCAADCACKASENCNNGACEPKSTCGNAICEPTQKEDCTTCPSDCKCATGQTCTSGSCQASCGNGTCESAKGENCSSCAKDCACTSSQACKDSKCQQLCPSDWSSFWRCVSGSDERRRCGFFNSYQQEKETCKYGCKPSSFGLNATCCACKPGDKRCSGTNSDDLQECQSDCNTWKTIQTCDKADNHFCGAFSKKCLCYTFNACSPAASYQCSGQERQFCYSNSTSQCTYWRPSALPCEGSTPLCIEGKCCACKAGTKRCNGKTIETCQSDCRTWKVSTTCSTGYCCNLKCGCI